MPLGLLCAAVLAMAGTTNQEPAESTSLQSLVEDLEAADYRVQVHSERTEYDSLNVDGVKLSLDKYGATAEIELLSYPSRAAMLDDWRAIDGEPPEPLEPFDELEGRKAYWHGNDVLLVDYEASNDEGTAWIAALVFLGLTNISPDGLPIGTIPEDLVGAGG